MCCCTTIATHQTGMTEHYEDTTCMISKKPILWPVHNILVEVFMTSTNTSTWPGFLSPKQFHKERPPTKTRRTTTYPRIAGRGCPLEGPEPNNVKKLPELRSETIPLVYKNARPRAMDLPPPILLRRRRTRNRSTPVLGPC